MPNDPTTKSLTDLTDESVIKIAKKKFDRFHPEMPNIPGVSSANVRLPEHSPTSPSGISAQRLAQAGGMIAAIVVVAIGILGWIKHTARTPIESPSPGSAATESPVPDLPPLPSVAQAHEGPTIAATVEELSKPWSSKKFTFVKPPTNESVDAMVIRLPSGGLWAFALREPYGRCDLEFVTDLGQIERKYGYRATHPMTVNPCNNTVYDPLKVGSLGGNTWARGEVVQGVGLRPPIAVDAQVHGHFIIADGIE